MSMDDLSNTPPSEERSVSYGGYTIPPLDPTKIPSELTEREVQEKMLYEAFSQKQNCSEETVNHPQHYKAGSLEVIDIIESYELNFSLGNAIKYILRADRKGNPVEDLEKAIWYLSREIENRNK